MKFTNGYEEGFCGAEGWNYNADYTCEQNPFYAYTTNGIIIVDNGGISYYNYDETDACGNMKGWNNNKPIDTYTDALNLVNTLEGLNLDEFAEYIKMTYTQII